MPRLKFGHVVAVVVKHCNLSCAACNHLSPLFKASFIKLDEFERNVRLLSKHLVFDEIWIQGGEPLLHPEIIQIMEIAKSSGIAERITIQTNGTHLHKMSQEFWNVVDRVDVSAYPGVKIEWELTGYDNLKKAKTLRFQNFAESFSTLHNPDKDLVERIKSKCNVLNVCFGILDGYFYKCARSSFIPTYVKHERLAPETVDGIEIEDTQNFGNRLSKYLGDQSPLKSCEFCTGSAGLSFPHTQTNRSDWLSRHHKPIKDLIDPQLL